jgi:hypothetical protein
MNSSQKGNHAELLFCAEAGARGYGIYAPWGGDQKVDVCLSSPNGGYIGVQVKRACIRASNPDFYQVNTSSRSSGLYAGGAFDVLAAYLPDRNEFVFWHIDEIRQYGQISYSPKKHRKPGNWQLLEELVTA